MMVILYLFLNQPAQDKVSQMEYSKMIELGLELGVETNRCPMQWKTVAYKLMLVASLEAGVLLQWKADCLVVGSGCALAVNSQIGREFDAK